MARSWAERLSAQEIKKYHRYVGSGEREAMAMR